MDEWHNDRVRHISGFNDLMQREKWWTAIWGRYIFTMHWLQATYSHCIGKVNCIARAQVLTVYMFSLTKLVPTYLRWEVQAKGPSTGPQFRPCGPFAVLGLGLLDSERQSHRIGYKPPGFASCGAERCWPGLVPWTENFVVADEFGLGVWSFFFFFFAYPVPIYTLVMAPKPNLRHKRNETHHLLCTS